MLFHYVPVTLPGVIFSKQQRTASCNWKYKIARRMSLLTLLYKYRKKDAFINAFINLIEQAVGYPIQAQHMRFEPSRWHILAIDTLFSLPILLKGTRMSCGIEVSGLSLSSHKWMACELTSLDQLLLITTLMIKCHI